MGPDLGWTWFPPPSAHPFWPLPLLPAPLSDLATAWAPCLRLQRQDIQFPRRPSANSSGYVTLAEEGDEDRVASCVTQNPQNVTQRSSREGKLRDSGIRGQRVLQLALTWGSHPMPYSAPLSEQSPHVPHNRMGWQRLSAPMRPPRQGSGMSLAKKVTVQVKVFILENIIGLKWTLQ